MLGELEPRLAALQRLLLHVCRPHLCSTLEHAAGQQGCWAGGQTVGQAVGLSSGAAHPCQVTQLPIHGCGLGASVGCLGA